jgi:hypothetical protein
MSTQGTVPSIEFLLTKLLIFAVGRIVLPSVFQVEALTCGVTACKGEFFKEGIMVVKGD